jgi:hypothetical protein
VVVVVEEGHVVAGARELNGGGDAGRARADDGGLLAVLRGGLDLHAVEVRIGHKALDVVEGDRAALAPQHAVAGALGLVVADHGAHRGHGVVLKEHPAGLHQPVFAEGEDCLRDGGMDRAAFLAHGFFALQAPVCFFYNMNGHKDPPLPLCYVFLYIIIFIGAD